MPHLHEKIDFTVEVFIVHKNKVLLRKHDKYGIWLSVGGHIELNEDPNQAATREVKEEVGLDIILDNTLQTYHGVETNVKELIPPYFLNRNRISDSHEHITLTYFAKSKLTTIKENTTSEKSNGIRWFTREDLDKSTELHPNIKFYAIQALNKLAE